MARKMVDSSERQINETLIPEAGRPVVVSRAWHVIGSLSAILVMCKGDVDWGVICEDTACRRSWECSEVGLRGIDCEWCEWVRAVDGGWDESLLSVRDLKIKQMRREVLKNEATTIQRSIFYIDTIICRERNIYLVTNRACLANRRWPLQFQPCVQAWWGKGGRDEL